MYSIWHKLYWAIVLTIFFIFLVELENANEFTEFGFYTEYGQKVPIEVVLEVFFFLNKIL